MKKNLVAITIIAALAAAPAPGTPSALAHPGRTDSRGGHNDNINGGYHYHNGGSSNGGSSGGSSGSSGSSGTSTSTKKPSAPRATKTPTPPTPRPATAPTHMLPDGHHMQYGKCNGSNVNLRESHSTKSKKAGTIKSKGTAFEILDTVENEKGETWYHIWYNGELYYVFAEYVDLMTEEDYLAGR